MQLEAGASRHDIFRRGGSVRVGIIVINLFLISCSAVPPPSVERPLHYDYSFTSDYHGYSITTDSSSPIEITTLLSNHADDTACEHAHVYGKLSIVNGSNTIYSFHFDRKASPNVALYEWHMCFVRDDVVYKAWRGFDPGPNTSLKVSCFLPSDQLGFKDIGRYLCHAERVVHAQENYSDVAQYCWSKEVCRRFETEADYELFRERGADNVALRKRVPTKTLREVKVSYEYLDDEAAQEIARLGLSEHEQYCSKLSVPDNICREELAELEELLQMDDAWRYQLTDKALVDSIPELKGKNVVFRGETHMDRAKIFEFIPHEVEGESVLFYSVRCPASKQEKKFALCTIFINQAFYSDNPLEYFNIEDTSDVNTALWAHSVHKNVEVVPDDDWMSKWLEQPNRVSTIEIDGTVAKFHYHSGGCSHQIWYRIVGNNEELEYLKTGASPCI